MIFEQYARQMKRKRRELYYRRISDVENEITDKSTMVSVRVASTIDYFTAIKLLDEEIKKHLLITTL